MFVHLANSPLDLHVGLGRDGLNTGRRNIASRKAQTTDAHPISNCQARSIVLLQCICGLAQHPNFSRGVVDRFDWAHNSVHH
jgi:hypothetical protein